VKYIISFTTSPTRIHKFETMVNSLLTQTVKPDLIILNIPKVFKRTSEEYTIPPGLEDKVFINRIDKDYGPATKVIPTVQYLKDNNFNPAETRIVYLDDDVKYPPAMLEVFKEIPNDNSIYVSSGIDFRCAPGSCDNLTAVRRHNAVVATAEGYGGVCIRLDTFKDDFMEYINIYIDNMDFYLSDDVVLSNYYISKGAAIKVINVPGRFSVQDIWTIKGVLDYGFKEDALHKGANGISVNNEQRYKNVLSQLGIDGNRYIT
tara:strand:+ start:5874 stop:6656 length:783 start_codon:yes stop_codon:yes gene_type:complete